MKISFKGLVSSFVAATLFLASSVTAFAAGATLLYVYNNATPPAQTVAAGQQNVSVFHFDLYSRGVEGAKVTKITFNYSGLNNGDEVQNIALYDFSTKQTLAMNSMVLNNQVIFTGLNISLPKNTAKKFGLKMQISPTPLAASGETFKFSIADVSSYGTASGNSLTTKNLNASSNLFTIASLGQLTLSKSVSQPSQTVLPGMDQPVLYFNIKTGANPMTLKNFTYDYQFSGQPAVSVFRIRDFNTKQVLTSFTPMVGTHQISLSTYVTLSPITNTQFEIVADVMAATGPGNTFVFTVKSAQANDAVTAEQVDSMGSAMGNVMIVGQ